MQWGLELNIRLCQESTRFFDLSGDMLCTVDFDGHLRRVNGEWRKTLGWSPAELIGRHVSELMGPEDHELMGDAAGAVGGRLGLSTAAAGAGVTASSRLWPPTSSVSSPRARTLTRPCSTATSSLSSPT